MSDNTGWQIDDALGSTIKRFKIFKPSWHLNFSLLSPQSSKQIDELLNGNYVGFLTKWPKHAYTLHAVREKKNIHFIYVNRGQRHFTLESGRISQVIVFTVQREKAREFANEMFGASNSY
ncbi:hypothetical protein [Legionella gresilensis]|uniref:hypothetical protein n=1 Tax=Legionella gresilensis TaxID=91823 RepID=UPI0010418A60|nr:hypothetical protein [Legionella gresilensis]